MAVAPNPSRRVGFTPPPPSPAPFLTPRLEKRPSDLRWADGVSAANRNDKDREVNVQVVLRCRPLSDEEQRMNVQKAISCNEQKKEVIVLQNTTNKQADKTFVFDKVFGPKAQQKSIYDYAISPFVKDVLDGFNCTVFAYGQTGTGKTYTMEGGMRFKGGDLSGDAGVIPRVVHHIFDALEAQKAEYTMKVTFLELYNEEILDLLVSEDHNRFMDDKQRRSITLMDDGKGGAVIRGLQEEVVYCANDVHNLLERGSAKRQTADTLLNKQSSRSHSIFSITILVKEVTIGYEELVKCGRLNLVDLAGSENISKSGAREGRAREAGEMNKSLLTLGRVITALVEHSAHIPYRDSKLTRLLRESLGGKAKTCMIATVSPSVHSLEETLNTLDYAYRAKSIRNKPEANQKVSKAVLLKDLYWKIERLKQDVRAATEKNGVFIPQERLTQYEEEKKVMNGKIERLEFELDFHKKEKSRFQELHQAEQERNLGLESEIRKCKESSDILNKALEDLQAVQTLSNSVIKEKEFIISNLLQSGCYSSTSKRDAWQLGKCFRRYVFALEKIEQQTRTQTGNHELVLNFSSQLDQSLKNLQKIVIGSVCQHHRGLRSIEEHVSSFLAAKCEATRNLEMKIAKIKDVYVSRVHGMREHTNALQEKYLSDLDQMKLAISLQTMAVENFLVTAVSEAELVLDDIQKSLKEQKELLIFSTQQQEAGLRQSIVATGVISKSTINFFNDLQERASCLIAALEENQMERSHQLAIFETKFKETSANDEKEALEKITRILRNLTTTKDNMVLEALHNMNDRSSKRETGLQLEMTDMHQVSAKVKSEVITHLEKVESQFQEDTASAAKTGAIVDNLIQSCLKNVDSSREYWELAQLSLNQLNESYASQIGHSVGSMSQEHTKAFQEFMLLSGSTDNDYEKAISHLLAASKDSVLLDHEISDKMNSSTAMCVDQLQKLQYEHSESIKNLEEFSNRCFSKEYLVDDMNETAPKKPTIAFPSWASIEELKTPCRANSSLKVEAEGANMQYSSPQTPRSPRVEHSFKDATRYSHGVQENRKESQLGVAECPTNQCGVKTTPENQKIRAGDSEAMPKPKRKERKG